MRKKTRTVVSAFVAAAMFVGNLSGWSALDLHAEAGNAGSELVVNGDFEASEVTGWTSNYGKTFAQPDLSKDPLEKNGMSLHVTGRWNQWSVAAYELSDQLEGGLTYRFSVDVLYNEKTSDDQNNEYAVADTQDFLLQLGNADNDERTKYFKQRQTVKAGEWTTISYDYTVPFEVGDSLWLNLETDGGSFPQNRTNFYVDNVSVREIDVTNDAAYALKKLNILQYYPEYQAKDQVMLPSEMGGYKLTWESSKPEVLRVGADNTVTYTHTEEDTVVRLSVTAGDTKKDFYIESKRQTAAKSLLESEDMTSKPALGWNSFDGYICSVTEDQILENAEFIAGTSEVFQNSGYETSLKDAGYEYIVVDQAWFMDAYTDHQTNKYTLPNYKYFGKDAFHINQNGYWVVDEERFPSAAKAGYQQPQSVGSNDPEDAVVEDNNGFKALADKIHSMGLKFGIHLQSGIPKTAVELKLPVEGCDGVTADMIADYSDECGWNDLSYGIDMSKPGAQEYLNNEIKRYAQWGVDFLKIDDLATPYHEELIEGYRKAIDNCGRSMYLSASPGPTSLDVYEKISSNANMWRIIDDLWDRWEGNGLNLVIDKAQEWADKITDYHYPDGDMVPFGQLEGGRFSKFSEEEKRSLMTLYAMNKSPVMLGGRMNGYLGISDDAEFAGYDWISDQENYDDLKYVLNEDFININQNAVNVELVKKSSTAPIWSSESEDGTERYLGFINATGYYPEGEEWKEAQEAEPASVQTFTVDLGTLDDTHTYVSAREVWSGKEVAIIDNKITMELNPEDAALIVLTAQKTELKPEGQVENLFDDVNTGDWYVQYVQYVYENGIMTGYSHNQKLFGATDDLSRAHFAVILYRMEGCPEVSYETKFPDVADGTFYTDAVLWAVEKGIITGYTTTGTFGPADDITREQLVTMLYRYANYKNYDTSARTDLKAYPDASKVSSFASDAMSWAVANELIKGDQGRLNPQGKTSRAVCATIITRFMEQFEK